MELNKRLDQLVGHEVLINRYAGNRGYSANQGILAEVGGDYMVIEPDKNPYCPLNSDEKYSGTGAYWFVTIEEAMPILHIPGCKKCSAKSVA